MWDCRIPYIRSDTGTAFLNVKDALQETFLPDLLKGDTSQIPGILVTSLPVKQSRIALLDLTQTEGANWMAPCVITGHLVSLLCRTVEFRSGDHDLLMEKGRDEIHWWNTKAKETALGEAHVATSTEGAHRIGWITRMGTWLSVLPSTVNGTGLWVQDWRDSCFLHYGIEPSNLPGNCDGCGAAFGICHILD